MSGGGHDCNGDCHFGGVPDGAGAVPALSDGTWRNPAPDAARAAVPSGVCGVAIARHGPLMSLPPPLIPDPPPAPRWQDARPRYDALPAAMDITEVSVEWALQRIGYLPPEIVITCGTGVYFVAKRIAAAMTGSFPAGVNVSVRVDHALRLDEWYVEYNGRRAGSPGA